MNTKQKHMSTAVDWYDVKINEETGRVTDFIAHKTDDTPQEAYDMIYAGMKELSEPFLVDDKPLIEWLFK